MYVRRVKLDNATGLHVRPATLFVAEATRFQAAIQVTTRDRVADGKSAISLMMLEAPRDAELIIQGSGEDEAAAVDALVRLVESRFAEPA
jgi:phosphocarrier protein HPr